LGYKHINRCIIKYIIDTVKQQNLSYRNLIRNYANNIILIRDNILAKANLDINDWLNDNITSEQFNLINKEISDTINRIN
jgi:hypothetical protein